MATIVFMDHDEGAFNPNSLGVLAKAASLGGEVTAFVGGSGIDDAWAGGLGAYGASKVLVADDAALAGLPQPLVDALEPHAREADAVLFGAGVVSADVAAGLAARVGEAGAQSVVRTVSPPPAKQEGRRIEDTGGDSAGAIVEFLAERGVI